MNTSEKKHITSPEKNSHTEKHKKTRLWEKSKKAVLDKKGDVLVSKKIIRDKLDELKIIGSIRMLEAGLDTLNNAIKEANSYYNSDSVTGKIAQVLNINKDIYQKIFTDSIISLSNIYDKADAMFIANKDSINAVEREKIISLFHTIDSAIESIKNNKDLKKLDNESYIKISSYYGKEQYISKNEKDYFQNYKKLNDNLAKCLGINIDMSESVIERESGYNKTAISPTGARGYMQLTSQPFSDIFFSKEGRGDMYVQYFAKLDSETVINNIPDKRIKETMSELKILSLSNPIDKSKWNAHISNLRLLRNDPYVNLIIGDIYLAGLKGTADNKSDKSLNLEINKLSTISITRFKSMLAKKGINIDNPKSVITKLIHELKEKNSDGSYINPELRQDFYILSKYNGDVKTFSKGKAPEKTHYAATVLAQIMIKQDNNISKQTA
ncbi:MAG: lytic transglycosylase domain-containing protein [Candidatus Gracilibacteria bacterium]|nr:lytic transglycosylase domain-containing protein [Candidatus Gracilibacteria bacterium]MDD2909092.1 lytic transglycosylase domain-containing protein [Candidatus Gracilibacteria bacterium]